MKKVDYFGLWQHRKSRPKFNFHKEQKFQHEHESKREQEDRQRAVYDEVTMQRRVEITTLKDELKRLTSTHAAYKGLVNENDILHRRDELMHTKKVLSELMF